MNFHSKKIDSLFIQLKHSLKLEDLDERKNMKANFDGKMIRSIYVSTQICPVHKRVSEHSDQNLDYRTNSIWHHFFQRGDCRAKACLLRFISFWKTHISHYSLQIQVPLPYVVPLCYAQEPSPYG